MVATSEPRRAAGVSWSNGLISSWSQFWFAPTDVLRLDAVRMLVGLTILAFLWSIAGYQSEWFGLHGYFDAEALNKAYRALPEEDRWRQIPMWSPAYMAGSAGMVNAIYAGTLIATLLFTLGLFTRYTGLITWLGVVAFTSNPVFQGFDADSLLLAITFYLAIGYIFLPDSNKGTGLAQYFTTHPRWPMAKLSTQKSAVANIILRLIQLHICLFVIATVSAKLRMPIWWSGLALWFPLHQVPVDVAAAEALYQRVRLYSPDITFTIISLATYGILAWQLTYPFLVWRRPWQPLYIAGALLGWLGCIFIYELPFYGPLLLAGTVAHCPAAFWQTLFGRVATPEVAKTNSVVNDSKDSDSVTSVKSRDKITAQS